MSFMKKALAVCLAALTLLSFSVISAHAAEGPTIEETTLVDESDVKITATELEVTDRAAELTLTLENNTAQNLTFRNTGSDGNAVNGYMVDTGYLSADLAAGKKSRETVRFDLDELAVYGITDIASIEMGFNIEDDEYDEYLQVPPIRLDTSLAGQVDEAEDTYQASISSEELSAAYNFAIDYIAQDVLYEAEGVRMSSEVLLTDQNEERELFLELENTTDVQVYIRLCDFTINGLQVQNGIWSSDCINSGKRRVIDTNLSSILKNAYGDTFGITDIANIAFTLRLADSEGNELAEPQTVNITIPGIEAAFDDSGEIVYDESGIQIISKGLVPDSFELSDDIHALFLIKNSTSDELDVDCANDSVSVNGFMNDELCFGCTAKPNAFGILDVELSDDSLADNGCDSIEDIDELELTVTIRDDSYNTLAEPVITLQFNGES